MLFFWILAPCRLAGRCQHFAETYCLHLQGWRNILSPSSGLKMRQYVSPKRWHLPTSLHGAKTQKNSIIILTAFKISNLTQVELFSDYLRPRKLTARILITRQELCMTKRYFIFDNKSLIVQKACKNICVMK
jgi:hypothetical protein